MAHPTNGTLFVRDSRTKQEYEIPIVDNAVLAVDFKNIRGYSDGSKMRGLLLYDPGLQNTAIKRSQISSSDARGLPMIRGYSVEQLYSLQSDFEDLFHLMVLGKYPTPEEKEILRHTFAQEMINVPDTVVAAIKAFPPSSTGMSMMLAGLSAYLASYDHAIPAKQGGNLYHNNPRLANKAAIKTTAAYAVVLGLTISHRKGIPFAPAQANKSFYENLFNMMGMADPITKLPNPLYIDVFRRAAILNADNGMTHSTFLTLVAGSALPDPLSCLISATSAAYGPLHYGAQEATWNNLIEIETKENVPAFLEQVKRRERRLFGYGHRVHKTEDPRLAIIKGLLKELNVSPATIPLMEIAYEIDRLAALDQYFTSRGLSANADFYFGFLIHAFGFDPDMITLANLAMRILGLMAHWREAMDQEIKLFRPLHIYTGPKQRITAARL
uniref:Citrate synthase n=1 Tax=Diffractella curvata TaxID=2819868 RepID=A0A7R6QR58_9PEZI|nr:ZopR3 [Diffractella curvata]BBU42028.1 putative citrate synthase [Diffractella curvata]